MMRAIAAIVLSVVRRAGVLGLVVAVLVAAGAPRAAWASAPGEGPAVEPEVADAPARLEIANREILTLRTGILGATPADRVAGIGLRVDSIVERGGPLVVTTQVFPEGIGILIDGALALRVMHEDVDPESGETTAALAERAVTSLRQALDELREARDSGAMLRAAGRTLLATVVFVAALWVLWRGYLWTSVRLVRAAERRAARLDARLGSGTVRQLGLARLVVAPARLLGLLAALLLVYEWLGIVLKQFPYTRPWGETLLGNLLHGLGVFAARLLQAVPGLLVVLLIFLVARFVVRVLRAFFESAAEGRVQLPWLDDITARPTGRLLAAVVWLLALVAAYPYFPGSGSEAFKGIGVFVGLMLSIGSSGIVNQAVSGLMLMYTRALRPGEFVQVGETEGTVRAIGFLTTQLETLRHEHVTIPNALLVGTVTRNFSRSQAAGGLRVRTAVTIGYDAPWRQVQAMLRVAAQRTAGILQEPPPVILQTALLDHAVEYTLLVSVSEPTARLRALDELHANIQDVFNEHGVQIMSPRYEADPLQPKVVPPEQWFRPPASS